MDKNPPKVSARMAVQAHICACLDAGNSVTQGQLSGLIYADGIAPRKWLQSHLSQILTAMVKTGDILADMDPVHNVYRYSRQPAYRTRLMLGSYTVERWTVTDQGGQWVTLGAMDEDEAIATVAALCALDASKRK